MERTKYLWPFNSKLKGFFIDEFLLQPFFVY